MLVNAGETGVDESFCNSGPSKFTAMFGDPFVIERITLNLCPALFLSIRLQGNQDFGLQSLATMLGSNRETRNPGYGLCAIAYLYRACPSPIHVDQWSNRNP